MGNNVTSTISAGFIRIQTEAPAAVREEMRRQAEVLLAQAQSEAPDLTGELIASGHVEEGTAGPEVVFDAPHALIVHERLDVAHPKGGAKYLERSTLDLQQQMTEAFQRALNGAIDGASK